MTKKAVRGQSKRAQTNDRWFPYICEELFSIRICPARVIVMLRFFFHGIESPTEPKTCEDKLSKIKIDFQPISFFLTRGAHSDVFSR